MQTTSKRRIAIPARHNISPFTVPAKNSAIMNDSAAPINNTICKYLMLPPITFVFWKNKPPNVLVNLPQACGAQCNRFTINILRRTKLKLTPSPCGQVKPIVSGFLVPYFIKMNFLARKALPDSRR